jgi:N-acetylmuramoyl-L-alanine amidase
MKSFRLRAAAFTVLSTLLSAAAFLLLAAPAARAVEFAPLRTTGANAVTFGGGTFADTTFEDVAYVSSEFLSQLFATTPRWEPAAQQLRLRDPAGREWAFTLDNPFVAVQGKTYNLTYPARRGPERVYLPLHPLLRLLRARLDIDLRITGARLPLAAPAPAKPAAEARVTGMTLEETPEGSVLRIRSTPSSAASWQGVLTRPHYILRAFGGALDAAAPKRLEGAGPLQSVEARQQGNTLQFTLRLRGARDSVELAQDDSGWRVTVRPAPAAGEGKRATVIVDAGHGGKDPGAIVQGVREADVNLAVAKQLRVELEARGYRVLLTREDDTFKTLPERPKFASDSGGDLFISLHCNSMAGTAARLNAVSGYVGYILREAESEEDKAIARRENQAAEEQSGKKKTEISPLDWILLEHQLNLYSKQSESLVESVVRNFAGFEIPKYTTGARQAGFFVLVGAYMPAMLFEMGFLTNPSDRAVLSSKDGQREIARRLATAVDGFQKTRVMK